VVDDEVMHPTPSWPLGGSPKAPYIEGHDGTVREGRSVVAGGDWDVPVQDRELSFIRVDHQTRLQFGATEVVIECPFRLQHGGKEHEIDPEQRDMLGPVLDLYPGALRSATVTADCALTLELVSGSSISIPPHPSYEAWQIKGPGERLIVCAPGGASLSVWE